MNDADDLERLGALKALQQSVAFLRAGLIPNDRTNVPDVRVDRVTEHEHLDDRNEQREEE